MGTGQPRCAKYEFGEEKTAKSEIEYFYIKARYLDFDGKAFGEASNFYDYGNSYRAPFTDSRFHLKSEYSLDTFVSTLSAVGYRAGQILEVMADPSAYEYELVRLTDQQFQELEDRLAAMHSPPARILT
ncbi:hypothetical protein B0O99DRAFT_601851 [Bisporella sp. PMI_857]|nr:hypothetical protein B0O99DRAFT_601851 [Bisporella sp. PMI_857]